MALVDDRGRLFGRLNLFDAVVGVFVIGLIPLLYGAVVLFRTPPPEVLSVEPAQLAAGPGQRVTIRGRNLRPYMRVSFGALQGKDFLFKSTTEAEINLNDMPPGVYDVVLYDFAQERSRIANAFTMLPAPIPPTKMIVVGMFGGLDAARAKTLAAGLAVPGVGTILQVGAPMPATVRINPAPLVTLPVSQAVMVPAVVEVSCDVRVQAGAPYCHMGALILQTTTMLAGEMPDGKLPFQIDQIRSTANLETVTVTARISGVTPVVKQIRTGDVDLGLYVNPLAAGAKVLTTKIVEAGDTSHVDVTVELRSERTESGWQYAGLPLRAGAFLTLRTQRYELSGLVLLVSPEWSAPSR
jgi:hypothetical protein